MFSIPDGPATTPATSIRTASQADLDAIVVVHSAAFPGAFLSRLGPAFLLQYYALVLRSASGVLLVALADGQVAGFVAGTTDPRGFYNAMRHNALRFAPVLFYAIARSPRLVLPTIRNALRVQRWSRTAIPPLALVASVGTAETTAAAQVAELTSLGVHPSYAGRGAGRMLIREFIRVARLRGASAVELVTGSDANERVNRLYRSEGFAVVEEYESGGRRMSRHRLKLSALNAAG